MDEKHREDVLIRLKNIDDQVKNIMKMILEKRYCIDVLDQSRAVVNGMKKVENIIMSEHLKTCVVDSFKKCNEADKEIKIEEIMNIFTRFRDGGIR